jgi:hypothetical protein
MIDKHRHIIERLLPIIIIVLLGGTYLLYKEKIKTEQAIIIAKDAVINQLKVDHSDSAILGVNEKVKALDSEQGLDSLIINFKQ